MVFGSVNRLYMRMAVVLGLEGAALSFNEIELRGWTAENRREYIHDCSAVTEERRLDVYDSKNMALGFDYRKRA